MSVKSMTLALSILAVLASTPMLAGCNTTAGVGEDISAGGRAITKSAVKNTP